MLTFNAFFFLELDAHLLNFQLGSWILTLASFPLAFLVVRTIKETNYDDEKVRDVANRPFSPITHHMCWAFHRWSSLMTSKLATQVTRK